MILYINKLENDTFNRIAVIDNATSVIWVKRFNDIGQFELYIKASPELINLFQGDIFITRDESNVGMYVEKIKLTTDAENGDYLTISGRSAECILAWKYITRRVYSSANTTAEYIIRDVINTILIESPVIIRDDAISWLSLGTNHNWDDKITRQFTGKSLYEIVMDLCVTYNYGFEFAWNGAGFTINLYKGTDRSYGQTENTFVVFSPEFENLGNTEYLKDTTNFANIAWIGGEGEGENREFVLVGTDLKGFYRRMIYVDARNSSSDGGQIPITEYRKMLYNQGVEAIEKCKITQTFNGDILNYNNYTYGIDYNLGDKVSIVNEYGISANATITEITEVEDGTGYRLIPTLSEWVITNFENSESEDD